MEDRERQTLVTARLLPRDIAHLQVLRGVSLESVWGLLENCLILDLAPGGKLISKGEANQIMYMILEGRLSVHLESDQGEPVAFVERGETTGEISVIDESPASAHVVAAAETRVLAVPEAIFWSLVAASHEFATNLLLLLAQRMRQNNSAISEGLRMRRRLEHEATVDALTGLRNRRWFDQAFNRLVSRYHRDGAPLSILMLDVDHFKRFNDDHGHAAGDAVLAMVARAIISRLRPTDLGARYGGEEFVVILPDTPLAGARVAGERVRAAIGSTVVKGPDDSPLPTVTISIGVAELASEDTADSFLNRADMLLYRAKANGRNRVEHGQ